MSSDEAQPTRLDRLVCGFAAAAVALAAVWATSRLVRDIPFAPLALAERVIRITPGGVATFFIEHLQHNAIRLLAAANVLGFLVLGALVSGAGPRRSHVRRPVVAGAVFGLACLAATLLAPPPSPDPALAALTAAAAGGLYSVTLAWLLAAVGRTLATETDLGRRRALAHAGTMTLTLLVGGGLLGRLVRRGPSAVAIRAADRAAHIPARGPFPDVPGLSPEITSPADHYVVDIDLAKPVIDPDGWTLKIDGAVEQPLELDLDALQQRFEIVEEYSVLTCVSNEVGGPLIGNSRWGGVRLADVLAQVRPQAGAVDLALRCADGYTVSVPLQRGNDPHAILALTQAGQPLRAEHGFPCRLRLPALYGMMNAKWLERIELVERDFRGYWADRGWSDVGIVRTESRIDTVAPAAERGRASWVAGVAWAGERRISRVEVSVDGGRSWKPAQLRDPVSPVAWTQWAYRWTPERGGAVAVMCRAADGERVLQDPRHRRPHPSGASGYHRIELTVA